MKSVSRLVFLIVFILTASLIFHLSCSSDSSTEPEPCSTLSIETVGLGIVYVSPDSGCYHSGTTVDLVAVPSSSWLFDSWSGNVSFTDSAEYDSAITLTVGSNDVLLTATFVEPEPCYTLTIETVGLGIVYVTPDSGCYHSGTTVDLIAVPSSSWLFDSWSGNVSFTDSAEYDSAITLTVGSNDVLLTATFVQGYTLTVSIDPANSGTVDVDPEQDYYAAGSTVTLTPSPATDYEFSHWTFAGDDSSYAFDPFYLTFGEADEVATAHFERTITLEGEPDCGTDYVDDYNGGCNSIPPVFLPIEDGQIYSGTSGTYSYYGYDSRDTDWYEYTATGNEVLIFKGEAEFPLLLFIFDEIDGCDYYEVLDWDTTSTIGDTITVSASVGPGIYWMWIGPMEYSGWPCPRDYTVWFDTYDAVSLNISKPIGISRQELSNSRH